MASILIVQGRAQCSPERQPSLKTVCWINSRCCNTSPHMESASATLDMLSYRSCLLMYLYISSTPSDLNGLLKSIYPEFLCPPSGRQRSPDMISNKIYIIMLRLLRSEANGRRGASALRVVPVLRTVRSLSKSCSSFHFTHPPLSLFIEDDSTLRTFPFGLQA